MSEAEDFLEKYKEDMDIISEPFLTEEGFVNEACMNELGKAIKNTPKTHERLAHDEEWTKKRWTFKHDITGSFAKWAIRQSGYHCPSHLEQVVSYLSACLIKEVGWEEQHYIAELSLCDINKLLYDILYEQGVSYFDDWNKPKKEWRETDYDCLGEAERNDPDYGYIDLDALLRNVCLDIRDEKRRDDEFDKRFEEENS